MNLILSIMVTIFLISLSYVVTESVSSIFINIITILISLRAGFYLGGKNMFTSIMQVFYDKGYLIYVDKENDDIEIKRKYADWWYNKRK